MDLFRCQIISSLFNFEAVWMVLLLFYDCFILFLIIVIFNRFIAKSPLFLCPFPFSLFPFRFCLFLSPFAFVISLIYLVIFLWYFCNIFNLLFYWQLIIVWLPFVLPETPADVFNYKIFFSQNLLLSFQRTILSFLFFYFILFFVIRIGLFESHSY